MEILSQIGPALGIVFDPVNLFLITLGIILGVAFGVLPGFGGSQALALLFPFSFLMSPETAVMFMLAVYCAAEYGGSIPAILIRTPGTTAAVMTILDGAPMAANGRPRRALTISIAAGVTGGIISTFAFILLSSSLAWVGLKFGPGELFAVGVFGLSIVGSFVGADPLKGFLGATIGLLLATVGDSSFGGTRFVFDQPYLYDGVPLIVMIVAMLAGPEAFRLMARLRDFTPSAAVPDASSNSASGDKLSLTDYIKLMPTMIRGGLIGTVVGAIPGPGPTMAAVLAYNEERRWSKKPQKFGTGVDEGIAAPESSNNAVVAGALVPALALGIPGSGAIAILLGVLISKGITPGPALFSEGGPLVMAVFIGLLMANVILLVVGFFGLRLFVPIARVPAGVLGPFVMALLLIGVYAYDNSFSHVVMLVALGSFAFLLDKFGVSTLPVILGFVMGPIIETNLGRALIIHRGDLWAVVSGPITATLLVISAVAVVWSYIRTVRQTAVEEAEAGEQP
ncbi:tripartite tricarboxylate transporter permease [Nitratireductor luteus]|uniref:tripartite tricarboxylate transporter permease n=1 Tax=Nitratireductor luteus TaxID=2976980 RepID=UPI002240AEE1|nr:tripartite tricarboxylate transporter permease [Nitratireductor luteus]